jgi:signal transduction histidine kinase
VEPASGATGNASFNRADKSAILLSMAGAVPSAVLGAQAAASSAPHATSARVRSFGWPADLRVRYPLGLIALVALYYGAGQLGFAFEFAGPVAAIVWLPVGVGIAFLYLAGLRFWPGVMIGDLLVNNYSALPLGSALAQTCGNVLEVLMAAWLMRRLVRHGSPLAGIASLTRTLFAITAAAAVSATVGTLSLRFGGVVATHALPGVWRTWWLGDSSGALVVVPLVIAWYRPPPWRQWRRRTAEAAWLLAAVVGLSALAMASHRPLTYLVFPALIWAALHFGQRGATLAIVIVSGFALWATTHYLGPFAGHSLTRSVLTTQLYIAVAALSTLCLAAVVSEREELAERLQASRARLVDASDTERRRLEHNLHDGAQQRLTALAVRLSIFSASVPHEPALIRASMEQAEAELALAIDELRELAHGIHPTLLTRGGLATALEKIAGHSMDRVELVELPTIRTDPVAEATAYYVFAEAVTNAQKHARASLIRVRAAVADGVLEIEIVDDGVGGAAESAGLGLQGLRDRVEGTGGSFKVDSAPGRGTRISAAIPATQGAP